MTFRDIQHRVLTGMLIVLPVMAIVLFIEKLWVRFRGLSEKIGEYVGAGTVIGSFGATLLFITLLIMLFLLVGSVAHKRIVSDFQNSLDRSILQFVPGYLTYKNKMNETIDRQAKQRIPVFVITEEGKRPGILIEKNESESVIFIPGIPDTNNGELLLVSNQQIEPSKMDYLEFIKSLQLSGKGILQ